MRSAPRATPPKRKLPSSGSSAAAPPPKISSPPSSPPLKPTPPLAKSPTPSAASLANTRNPSSSDYLMKLILAAASARRAEIVGDAGFSFTTASSAVDETPYPGESAHVLVERLAVAKAELVAARAAGPAIVIGADTEVTLEGHIFGKPRSSDDARHMLERLSARTHAVLTGVPLIRLPDAERHTFARPTLGHFAR